MAPRAQRRACWGRRQTTFDEHAAPELRATGTAEPRQLSHRGAAGVCDLDHLDWGHKRGDVWGQSRRGLVIRACPASIVTGSMSPASKRDMNALYVVSEGAPTSRGASART